MKKFMMLMRREYWENRGALQTTPIVIGSLMIIGMLIAIITVSVFSVRVNGEEFIYSQVVGQLEKISPEMMRVQYDVFLQGTAYFFFLVLFFVVFFYCLGSLYDDRKDRSVLFWRSLPVSDTATVMSKLATALLMAPLIMFVVVAITQIILMVIASVMVMFAGLSPWTYVWQPAQLFLSWGVLLLTILIAGLWSAPVFAWCILCSAFAKSKPFLWAVFVPGTVGFLQMWINTLQSMSFSNNWIWTSIGERLLFSLSPQYLAAKSSDAKGILELDMEMSPEIDFSLSQQAAGMLNRLTDLDLLLGIPFAVICILLAIQIRRYRDDA